MEYLEIIRTIIIITVALLSCNVYIHSDRIRNHHDLIENHKDVIEQHQKALENHKDVIEQHQKALENHKNVIDNYYFKIKELEIEIEKLKEDKNINGNKTKRIINEN